MTLLTICAGLALDVGMTVPDAVITSGKREWAEAVKMANEAGEELTRRVDWGVLRTIATLTGDGTAKIHDLGPTFMRLIANNAVRAGNASVRPLTAPEWSSLTMRAGDTVYTILADGAIVIYPYLGVAASEGDPRYFLLSDGTIQLYPYLADTVTATAQFQSNQWCSAGTEFMADTDTALIDEELLLKCLIVRWRRQKGMDYADHEAEYEAALKSYAGFDDGGRL